MPTPVPNPYTRLLYTKWVCYNSVFVRYFSGTDQYASFRNCFHERYLSERSFRLSIGLCFGLTGFRISFIYACSGVLPPFLLLHSVQAQTMFVQVVFPSYAFGTIWSRLNSDVGNRLPQYWHLFSSRAKMFLLLNFTLDCGSLS